MAMSQSAEPGRPDRSRPKGKPSVTPRSFGRFFAPKLRQRLPLTPNECRRALCELEDPDLNQRNGADCQNRSRKRVLADVYGSQPLVGSEAPTPELSSPLKRLRDTSSPARSITLASEAFEDWSEDETPAAQKHPSRVRRSRVRQNLGSKLLRELNATSNSFERRQKRCNHFVQRSEPQFWSDASARHALTARNADGMIYRPLPFCVAACRTNPLVAIGDEDGILRLMDTEQAPLANFAKAFLSFRVHNNAVLDLDFASDDSRLLSASGDQTIGVTEMRTQARTHTLIGHTGTVKQVRFQPNGGNAVIASSARDGSIRLWDLRCKQGSATSLSVAGTSADQRLDALGKITHPVGVALNAHARRMVSAHGPKGPTMHGRASDMSQRDVSVTSIAFLNERAPHLLLSTGEAAATVKLWDLRMHYGQRQHRSPNPIAFTPDPPTHSQSRQFGITAMALSGDGHRLYATCRDSNIYAYSTEHMRLGSAVDYAASSRHRPPRHGTETPGLGPLYGLRHPCLRVGSFYIKAAIRPAYADRDELLAVGGSAGTPIVMNTNDPTQKTCSHGPALFDQSSALAATQVVSQPSIEDISEPDLPLPLSSLYQETRGTALVNGHDKEVSGVAWAHDGSLVTIADDATCRVWREDPAQARAIRHLDPARRLREGYAWSRSRCASNNDDDDDYGSSEED